MSASCRKMTVKEQIAAIESATGRKITKDGRIGLELGPQRYVCTGAGVGGLRGSPVKKPKRRAKRRA